MHPHRRPICFGAGQRGLISLPYLALGAGAVI